MGLTLARQGDDANAFREIARGLKGLHEWIDYANSRDPSRSFWDPGDQIRKEIANVLAMISGQNRDKQPIIASAEWIGQEMEDEIELVGRDRRRRDD